MSAISRAAARFRKELLRRDKSALSEMVSLYSAFYRTLQPELNKLLEEIEREGDRPTRSQLMRRERLLSLLGQTEDELQRFGAKAATIITGRQQDNVSLAEENLRELTRLQTRTSTWTRLPSEQIEDLVGFARDGSPLAQVLSTIAPDGKERVRDTLLQGVVSGRTSTQIARDIKTNLGGNLHRALLVAKTEDMRAYTSSTIRSMRENKDIISGWTWHAALSSDSCMACIASHGTIHPLSENFSPHPGCRCIPSPRVKNSSFREETGEQWIGRQPREVQMKAMGEAKFELYEAGQIKVKDFITIKKSSDWGRSRNETPLKDLQNKAKDS